MRVWVQALSLFLFTLLFALANFRLPDWLPADIYLRLDPLLGLSAVLASREWIPRAAWGLVLILATILFGRFFCAYVCPLGAILDVLDPVLFGRARRPPLKAEAALRRVKLLTLAVFLGAAAAGASLVYLLDPIALLTRTYAFALYPPFVGLVNLLLDAVRPLAERLRWVRLATLSYAQPVFYMSLVTILVFAGIIALGRLAPPLLVPVPVSPRRPAEPALPPCPPAADGRPGVPGLRPLSGGLPDGRGAGGGPHPARRVHPVPDLRGGLPAGPHHLSRLAPAPARRRRLAPRPVPAAVS